jgi:hypothetical protein
VIQDRNDESQKDLKEVAEQNNVHAKNVLQAGRDIRHVHIGHLGDNYAPQPLQIQYSKERTQVLPIHIPTVRKYAFWTGLISFLGLVADCLTVLGFFGASWKDFYLSLGSVACLLFIVSATALVIWALSSHLKHGHVRVFGWTLRGDENQKLTRGKLCATCPICGGKINLCRPFKNSTEPDIGRCERFPKHTFTFDPTTMSGVECEILQFNFRFRP